VYEGCRGTAGAFLATTGADAFTVGSFVFGRDEVTFGLLAHELRHVPQYDKWGAAFLPAYELGNLVWA